MAAVTVTTPAIVPTRTAIGGGALRIAGPGSAIYPVWVRIAWGLYDTNGSVANLAAYFGTRVIGGGVIADLVADPLYRFIYIPTVSTGAPATGTIKVMRTGAVNAIDEELPNGTSLAAHDQQEWIFWGF